MTYSIETSAMAALAAIRNGEVSVQELTSLFLARIEERNGDVGAVRHLLAERAIDAARDMDARIQAGEALPALAGLPVLVKENCDTVGVPCSAGLAFRESNIPTKDSAITQRLRDAGAIILGVSVTDPGAFSVRTPDVTHPIDPKLVVGGSSGGSGAALAAGMCLGAIGTDTGGSIRIPSACCGTVGLKPTFNALPMEGIFPLVQSLDHVGPMGRNVEDVALLWRGLSGLAQGAASKPKRIGFDPAWVEISDAPIREAFALALEKLAASGIEAVEIKLPDLHDILVMHGEIFMVESAAYHLSHHGEHLADYPPFAQDWFEIARTMKVDTYIEAWTKRVAMRRAVDEILTGVDAIITPTICCARPEKDAKSLMVAGVETDYTLALAWLPCLFDETGHPALSVPVAGASDRLASSVQIAAAHGGEEMTIYLAGLLDQQA